MKWHRNLPKVFRVFIFDRDTKIRRKLKEVFEKYHMRRGANIKMSLIKSPEDFGKKLGICGECYLVVDEGAENLLEDISAIHEFCREMRLTTIRINLNAT